VARSMEKESDFLDAVAADVAAVAADSADAVVRCLPMVEKVAEEFLGLKTNS